MFFVQNKIAQALKLLQEEVKKGNFEFVNRRERTKSPISSVIAIIIIENLTIDDYVKDELDHNGSGDYIWVFKADDGTQYYIKFKFIENNRVKFISFHES